MLPLPRFDGCTTHQQSFGGRVTQELNAGTAKMSRHPPGFGGHVPAYPSLAAAAGTVTRPSRAAIELFANDQLPHGRLPGYSGFRPRHGAGLDPPSPTTATTSGCAAMQALRFTLPPATAGSHGIKNATRGFFSAGGSPHTSEQAGWGGAACCFRGVGTGRTPFVHPTDDPPTHPLTHTTPPTQGLLEAERFYSVARPLEGRMRGAGRPAPLRTAFGAKFSA